MNTAPAPNTTVFLQSAQALVDALANPVLAAKWDAPSALDGYTVGGLAGHSFRAIGTALIYLDQPESLAQTVGPAHYFLNGLEDLDPIDSDLHRSIRQRAATEAEAGAEEMLTRATADHAAATARLAETPDRTLDVFGGISMRLSDYLVTRIVEIVVHLDDLESSIGADLPEPPGPAVDLTLATLFEIAVIKHGSTEMLRALSREERVEGFPKAF